MTASTAATAAAHVCVCNPARPFASARALASHARHCSPAVGYRLGTWKPTYAYPEAYYSATSARCVCGDTITRRTDGSWSHGPARGTDCRRR